MAQDSNELTTKVVHCKQEKYDIYIGRSNKPNEGQFGNPFSHKEDSLAALIVPEDKVLECFELWLRGMAFHDVEPERRAWILDNLEMLRNKTLGCWCKSKQRPNAPCHGDIYVKLLAERS